MDSRARSPLMYVFWRRVWSARARIHDAESVGALFFCPPPPRPPLLYSGTMATSLTSEFDAVAAPGAPASAPASSAVPAAAVADGGAGAAGTFPVLISEFTPASVALMAPRPYKNAKGMYVAIKGAPGWGFSPRWTLGAAFKNGTSGVRAPVRVAFPPRPHSDAVRGPKDAGSVPAPATKLSFTVTLGEADRAALRAQLDALTEKVHAARGALFPAAHAAILASATDAVDATLAMMSAAGAGGGAGAPPTLRARLIEEASLKATRSAVLSTCPFAEGRPRPLGIGEAPPPPGAPPPTYPAQLRIQVIGHAPSVRPRSVKIGDKGFVSETAFVPLQVLPGGGTRPALASGDDVSEATAFTFGVGYDAGGRVVWLPHTAARFGTVLGVRAPGCIDLTPYTEAEVTFKWLLHVTGGVGGVGDAAVSALKGSWVASATSIVVWRSPPRGARDLGPRMVAAVDEDDARARVVDLVSDPDTSNSNSNAWAAASYATGGQEPYGDASEAPAGVGDDGLTDEQRAEFDAVDTVEAALAGVKRGRDE